MKMKMALSVIGASLAMTGAAVAQSASEWTGQVRLGGIVSQGAGSSAQKPEAQFFEDPSKQSPLADRRIYETAGFLGGKFESYGMIVAGENEGQMSFSAVDVVYINRGTGDGAKVGDRYFAFHPEAEEVLHPVTRDSMGHKVFVDGVLEVFESGPRFSKARITRSYNSVRVGYRIKPYEEIKVPSIDLDKPVKEKNINGVVVSSRDPRNDYAKGDIIYIDAGKSAGVEAGDVFEITVRKTEEQMEKDAPPSPDKLIGKARALSVEDNTATLLILSSSHATHVGDTVRYIQEREAVTRPVASK